jgi:ADP-dependent NAD(P)H-hydrate dehydratase / NAD(P)H-hydrate epimerase
MAWPPADAQHLLVTAAVVKGLEQELFANGLPVAALMEKAGLGLAQRLLATPGLRQRGVLVLVGPGHNGGDGLVVARELQLAGVPVQLWSPFEQHKPLTACHLRQALWLGIPRLAQEPDPHGPELWLDALFGVGQNRPLAAPIARLFDRRFQAGGECWGLDGPSGLCGDTGQPLGGTAAHCSRSLVVGLWKQGLWQDSALAWVGEQERIDLGLPASLVERWGAQQTLGLWGHDNQPSPKPAAAAAKHGRGRLRVIAGSKGYPGAGRLALEGASASAIGWLEGALPPEQAQQLWQVLPHVLLQGRQDPLDRLDAVVCGPGLGLGLEPGDKGLPEALQGFSGLLLLDADGLNRLASQGASGPWLRGRHGPTWITPHRTEFNRLFPALTDLPPLEAAAGAAAEGGAWVLLKGAHTVIASPLGRRWQLLESSPWAARAGLGDVLAGYAAGLGALGLAAGLGPHDPALGELLALAALRHGLAGLHCAARGEGAASPLAVAQQLAALEICKK